MLPANTTVTEAPTQRKGLFPLTYIRNIRLYYILTATNSAWFIAGNWIFFWTRYMTYGQLGLIDATAFAFGLVMEVPSGAISDLIGKKKTIAWAMFLSSAGTLGMAFSSSKEMIWGAFFVAQLGWALYSGAGEALAYDTLVDNKKEDQYDKVASASGAINSTTSVIATLLGGILYTIHYRFSHLAWGLTYLVGFFFSLYLTEPKTDTEKFSLKAYLSKLVDGIRQLTKPSVKPFLIVILSLLGIEVLYSWGLVKPAIATSFGFYDKGQAILFALFGILSALLVRTMPLLRKMFSDKKGLYILTLTIGFAFILAFLPLGYFGVIPMLLISLSGSLAYPWVSVVINKEIPSNHRATTLSAVALITKIPYVLLAIVAGNMVESGKLNIFNLGVGMFSILTILISSSQFLLAKLKKRLNILSKIHLR